MSVGNDALVGGGDRIAAAGEDADAVTALGQQGCTVSGDIAGATDRECSCRVSLLGDVDIGCWERADGKVPSLGVDVVLAQSLFWKARKDEDHGDRCRLLPSLLQVASQNRRWR